MTFIEEWPLDSSADRVRAVEHNHSESMPRRRLEHVGSRGGVRVETRADVLQINHQGVQPVQRFSRESTSVTVERVDRQSSSRVPAGRHWAVLSPTNAMLWTDQHVQVNVRRVME